MKLSVDTNVRVSGEVNICVHVNSHARNREIHKYVLDTWFTDLYGFQVYHGFGLRSIILSSYISVIYPKYYKAVEL